MKQTNDVYILLSTYNGEQYLRPLLESVLQQEGVHPHLIIRDDGSTDHTLSILEEYRRHITLVKGKNIGSTQSFMWLLAFVKEHIKEPAYYAFADQDDVWEKDKLREAVKRLRHMDENKPCLYCSNLKITDENLSFIKYMNTSKADVTNKARSLVESFATGCTMVFNRKALELSCQAKPHDVILHDLWLFHTCMFLGQVIYDPNAHILYRQHKHNQIGANATTNAFIKNKWKSIRSIRSQHFREQEARLLYQSYQDQLNKNDKAMLNVLIHYRQAWASRLRWLWGIGEPYRSIRMSSKKANLVLSIRILIGHV